MRLYEEKVIPYWRGPLDARPDVRGAAGRNGRTPTTPGCSPSSWSSARPGTPSWTTRSIPRACWISKRDIAAGDGETRFPQRPGGLRKARGAEVVRHRAATRSSSSPNGTPPWRASWPRRRPDPQRRAELLRIAEVCSHVPAHAPRDFHEALQYYWFCHLAVITELNGWDSFNPGHLDQHLLPFYERGLAEGTLTRESARELLECFFIKFNNHPAPPKVGVTAAESGTYTDFANINLGGLLRGRVRRLQRGLPSPAGHRGRDAPAPAQHQHPALAQEPGCVLQACLARRQPGLRFSLHLQRRRRGAGAAPPGQDARRRPRRRLQRLRGGGGVRQGGLHPHRLLQPGQGPGTRPAQRGGPADRQATGPADRPPGVVPELRRAVRRLPNATAAFHRDQGSRQPAHRADVRRRHARAVPERAD